MTIQRSRARYLLAAPVALALAFGQHAGASAALAVDAAPVLLGSAATFAVLAGSPSIANSGSTVVSGDIGAHPAAVVTGFPPGIVRGTIHVGDAVAALAKADLVAAYADAAGRTADWVLEGGAVGGRTLVAGVYSSGGATLDLSGTLTLDGQGDPAAAWVIQATADLVTAASSAVVLVNGAQACNVVWQVGRSAALGADSSFSGTILAATSITLRSRVSLLGRALATTGSVTLMNDTIAYPACVVPRPAAVPVTEPGSARPTGSPTIGLVVAIALPPTDLPARAGPSGIDTGPFVLTGLIVLIGLAAALLVDRLRLASVRAGTAARRQSAPERWDDGLS